MIPNRIVQLIFFSVLIFQNGSFAQFQDVKPVKLEAYDKIDKLARNEVSGIVKSKIRQDTYWVHGDSGTEDKIFAIDEDGNMIEDDSDFKGTKVDGAKNKDWEDIATGKDGTLIIGDIGNNCYCRNDLKIFVIDEPRPDDKSVEVAREYSFKYPKENDITSFFFKKSLNAEAIFVRKGKVHIISKNERNGVAKLFRLDDPNPNKENELTFVDSFDLDISVTAADISLDESQVAVLTKRSIWLFEPGNAESIFTGKKWWLPIKGIQQVESITFSGENLVIAEENGDLYKVPISRLVEYN